MRWLVYGCLLLAGFLAGGAGCHRPEPEIPVAADQEWVPLDHAQPRLPTLRLFLGEQTLVAEIARTPQQVATGMMFRQEMKENEAMLFVFTRPLRTSFYMRNTRLPLSCAYLDSAGTILEIHDLQPYNETPVEAATDQVQFVLETTQGWFERHHIGVGAVLRGEDRSLSEACFPAR